MFVICLQVLSSPGIQSQNLQDIIGQRNRGRPRCRWDRTLKEAFGSMEEATRIPQNRCLYHTAVREATFG